MSEWVSGEVSGSISGGVMLCRIGWGGGEVRMEHGTRKEGDGRGDEEGMVEARGEHTVERYEDKDWKLKKGCVCERETLSTHPYNQYA